MIKGVRGGPKQSRERNETLDQQHGKVRLEDTFIHWGRKVQYQALKILFPPPFPMFIYFYQSGHGVSILFSPIQSLIVTVLLISSPAVSGL